MIATINKMNLVIIPKNDNPETIRQFIPISLCNVVYKIITKVLANRLKSVFGDIISPHQCSFVPGRHSSDNIMIVQGVVHSMQRTKGKKGTMAIKVDFHLDKAYDRLKRSFLEETLMDIGLSNHFCNIIMQCVSSCKVSIIWNWENSDFF